jgi:hypothetical protein
MGDYGESGELFDRREFFPRKHNRVLGGDDSHGRFSHYSGVTNLLHGLQQSQYAQVFVAFQHSINIIDKGKPHCYNITQYFKQRIEVPFSRGVQKWTNI